MISASAMSRYEMTFAWRVERTAGLGSVDRVVSMLVVDAPFVQHIDKDRARFSVFENRLELLTRGMCPFYTRRLDF